MNYSGTGCLCGLGSDDALTASQFAAKTQKGSDGRTYWKPEAAAEAMRVIESAGACVEFVDNDPGTTEYTMTAYILSKTGLQSGGCESKFKANLQQAKTGGLNVLVGEQVFVSGVMGEFVNVAIQAKNFPAGFYGTSWQSAYIPQSVLSGGLAVADDGTKALPKWVLPATIGGGVLAVGVVAYLALRKR